MRGKSIFRGVVGVEKATVEDVWFEESGGGSVAVVAVRVWKRQRSRCGVCVGGVPAMTPAMGAVGGARWTWA